MSYIGIDLGATYIKGAVLDIKSHCITHVRRVRFPDFEHGAAFERVVSSDSVLRIFYGLLDELLLVEPSCEGLFLCGQMHALVFCDSFGQPQSNIITWQDQRSKYFFDKSGESYFSLLKKELRDWDLKSLGNELRIGLPLTQLFFLKKNNILPNKLFPVSLMDFVAANLCKTKPITDVTNAEAHGLFNVKNMNWDFDLIKRLGFDNLLWPEVRPHFSVSGYFSYNRHKIPCYVAIGDQQSALLGSFLEHTELSLNIATGSQVSMVSSSCEFGQYQTRPYFDGKYLKTITHIPAGRALNALIKLFAEIPGTSKNTDDIWEYIQGEISKIDNTNVDVNLNIFDGPLGAYGHISNMNEDNMTVGNIFWAAFKGMAENYFKCALQIAPNCDWNQVVFSGGLASKIPALQKMILGKFGNINYRVNSSMEDALMGLYIIAAKTQEFETPLQEIANKLRNNIAVTEN